MSVNLSNKSKRKNDVNEVGAPSKGLLSGRYPIGEQDGPGRHRTTTDRRTTRRKWSQEENRVVTQLYYRSEYERNGMK